MASGRVGTGGPIVVRVAAAGLAGSGAAFATDVGSRLAYAPAVGWITAATVYLVWTWSVIAPLDTAATRDHAVYHERDGTRHIAHVIVLTASLASLGGVGYLLYATSAAQPDLAAGAVGVLSVFASWFTIHTVYTLRYARLYFTARDEDNRGIDFAGEPPTYLDFAYVAFTVGMGYAVSDSGLNNRTMRLTVLSQALVSYLLGTVIIAITLNLVGGLTG